MFLDERMVSSCGARNIIGGAFLPGKVMNLEYENLEKFNLDSREGMCWGPGGGG
jgi:hypothetical protein